MDGSSLTYSDLFRIFKGIKPKHVLQTKRVIQRADCLYKWHMLFSNFLKSVILISSGQSFITELIPRKPRPENLPFTETLQLYD